VTRRGRRVLASLVTAVVTCILAAVAQGGTGRTKFSAALSAKQEVAKVASHARGAFAASLSGSSLKWSLTVQDLSGPVTTAHIALGTADNLGPVVVTLCNPCVSSHAAGTAKVSKAAIEELLSRHTYVNVYTAKHPNGEIRGQISESRSS